MPSDQPIILSVGQCGIDGPSMESFLTRRLKAKVMQADSAAAAQRMALSQPADLILINRILARDGTRGLDVLRALRSAGCTAPIMLVSDRPDAQDEAAAAGATRGFGKAELHSPATERLLREVLGL